MSDGVQEEEKQDRQDRDETAEKDEKKEQEEEQETTEAQEESTTKRGRRGKKKAPTPYEKRKATDPEDLPDKENVELTLLQALNRAMDDEMALDERVMVLGEDVGADGGIFRVTDGLMDKYGEHRVVDTPISEIGIAGVAIGLALNGMRPIAEFQFSGFSYQGLHQMEGHAARLRRRSQGRFVPSLVYRMPYGAGVRALEHHSESKETLFAHIPGLKVFIPRSPKKAYQMLRAAVRDPDPVVYMEPKYLYRRGKEEFTAGVKADIPTFTGSEVVREGDDVTIVSYGAMFPRAMEAAEELAADDIDAEVIDLQVIAPYDSETVHQSVRKTGRLVVFHEAHRTLGMGAEVAARVTEDPDTFLSLEAPIVRVTAPDITVALFGRENAYMPSKEWLVDTVKDITGF